ncbi:MAG TPA: hypothetical protein VKB47_18005 [Terracidiphilus sp.]|nr:hypothetical protein [Terracidiphilus sp.]
MRISRVFALVCLFVFAAGFALGQITIPSGCPTPPAGYMEICSAATANQSGALLSNATISFQPTDNNGNAIAYKVSGHGQAIKWPATAQVTSGAFQIQLADTALTSPLNVCFNVTVTDNSTGNSEIGATGYTCVQPAGSGVAVTGTGAWCNAGVGSNGGQCNFDDYTPNMTAGVVTQLNGGGLVPGAGLDVTHGNTSHVIKTGDATLGNGHQTSIAAAVQPQNYYTPVATLMGIGNMQSASGVTPQQIRVILNGDSTTGFHNTAVACMLAAQLGGAGFDFSGLGGVQLGEGEPCNYSVMTQSVIASSGTYTINNGAGSITAGSGAPYDYTRSPTGSVYNIASGASITMGGAGAAQAGNTLKVYYIKENLDGIYAATPGTMTVTITSSSSGPCPSGCVQSGISLSNASSVGGVLQINQSYDPAWSIKIAATGGAVDIFGIGIYDTSHNGVIVAGGTGRGGLTLPDSVSTPTAITAPWYASAAGQPVPITAWSCVSTLCTFTAANNYYTGQKITLAGFPTAIGFNQQYVTVASPTSTTFQATVSGATTSSGTDAGWALQSDINTLIMFEMKDNGQNIGLYPACTQATTANPSNLQSYSYWLGLYQSQWTTANSFADLEFTGSYDINDACVPVHNEAERELAQTNQYIYFDNFFQQTYVGMLKRGQFIVPPHSAIGEQTSGAARLWRYLGLDATLGAMAKPVSNQYTLTGSLFIGGGNYQYQSLAGVNTPNQLYPGARWYQDQFNNQFVDVVQQWSIWNGTHSAPALFCVQANVNSTLPAGCQVQVGTSGGITQIVNSSTANAFASTATNSSNGSWSWNYNAGGNTNTLQIWQNGFQNWQRFFLNGTQYWEHGLPCCASSDYAIEDTNGGRNLTVLDFPSGVMPAGSIGGNAKGATLLTVQTASNCAVNSASPAACGSAAAGAIVVPTTTTTYTVNTTAVQAGSRIFVQPRTYVGDLPSSPTCTTPAAGQYYPSAIVAGTSFTFTLPSTTGTTCWNYHIVN